MSVFPIVVARRPPQLIVCGEAEPRLRRARWDKPFRREVNRLCWEGPRIEDAMACGGGRWIRWKQDY